MSPIVVPGLISLPAAVLAVRHFVSCLDVWDDQFLGEAEDANDEDPSGGDADLVRGTDSVRTRGG